MQSKEIQVVPRYVLQEGGISNLVDVKYLRSIFSSLSFRISGTLIVGTADCTLNNQSILDYIKLITCEVNGGIKPKSMTGLMAYLVAQINHRVAPTLNLPAVGFATSPNAWSVEIPLDFELLRHHSQEECLLNTGLIQGKLNNQFKVNVLLGDITNVATAGSGGTVAMGTTYCTIMGTLINAPSISYPINMESMVKIDDIAGIGDFKTYADLLSGRPLKSIYIIQKTAGGAVDNTLIQQVRIRTQSSNFLREYDWDHLQDMMRRKYHLDVLPVGFGAIDLDDAHEDGHGILNTARQQQVYLELTTGTANQISVATQEIV